MKRLLLLLCCVVLLVFDGQSCNITIDSIVNDKSYSNKTRPNWPWLITVDSVDGNNSDNCLINQTIRCKTLDFVLNNIVNVSTRSTCLKLVLNKDPSKNSTSYFIPYNAPPLSGISLYFVGEENTLITCENNTGDAATAWSVQNATFIVFKSLHFSSCNRRLEISNVTSVYIENTTVSDFSDSGLRLFNNFDITLKDVSIVNCSHQVINFFPENSALSLVYRNSGRKASHVQILNSQFQYNSIKTVQIESTSEAVIGNEYPGRGGALGIFINEPIINSSVKIIIDECNFANNTAELYGGAMYMISNGLSSGHNLTLINSVFDHNRATVGGGALVIGSTKLGKFTTDTVFAQSSYHLANCSFTQNSGDFGGAFSFAIGLSRKRTNDIVFINSSIFDGNFGGTIGAAVLISSLTYPHLPEQDYPYIISNCTFKHNRSPSGILGITFKDVEFYETNHFIYNQGPSIRAADSNIAIHGNINFLHNLHDFINSVILVQDFVQFQLYSGSHMYFYNNTGISAAVFSVFPQEYPRVFSQMVYNPWCFLLYEDVERAPSNWTNVSITFDNNTAFLAPNIYISNLDLCSWQNTSHNQVHFNHEDILKWPVFDYDDIIRKRPPVRVKNNESDDKGISTAALYINGTLSYMARPGQPFTLDLMPIDEFGNPTGYVFGFTQVIGEGSVPTGRVVQYIDLSDEQNKNVILEPNIKEYLPGYRSLELSYMISPEYPSLKNFTIAVYAAVKLDVSDIPVAYVNITVDKCLPGQILRKATSDSTALTCQCDFKGTFGSILSCRTDDMIILQDGLVAFSHSNQIFADLQIIPCPPAYCQCTKENVNSTSCNAIYNYNNEQQQCHPDREGILCGSCRHKQQGVGVLTMLCQNCNNGNAVFLPLLVILDVALVILILYSATPFPPSLKGILFYIQVMSRAVGSFPLSTWRGSRIMLYISSALSLYFPWDFCLYDGMTALASHFFSYIPFIVAIIIIIVVLMYKPHGYTSKKGKKFLNIYQKFRSKCAHGIWTLVLLMFLRVSHNAWVINDCLSIADNGLRWYWDGNVQCFGDYKHMLLFLFGLIILSFTSVLMIFIGLLTIGALDIVTNKRATSRHLFESASYGYKEKYQWWAFMDIARRYILAFYWVNFPTYTTLQIFIFFMIFLTHVYAQPYKKAWHNWLDSFLFSYIIILLLLRSTNFIIEALLPNSYAGVMLPNESPYVKPSSPTEDPLPPSDALTYFFVPLLYIPVVIALIIISPMLFKLGRHIILWLHKWAFYCFQKCKRSQDTSDESEVDTSSIRIYKHSDNGVFVTRRDGRTTKVTSTYAEY